MTEGGTARYGKACRRLRTRRRVGKGERAFLGLISFMCFFFVNNLHNKFLKALCPHSRKRAGFVFPPPPHTVRVCFLHLSLSKPQKTFSVFLCILSNSPRTFCSDQSGALSSRATSSVWRSFVSIILVSLARSLSLSFSLSLYS